MAPIKLTVKTLDSANHSVEDVDDEGTIKDLKEKLAPQVGIEANLQRLIYCGRVLQDDKKIKEYDLNEKALHLVQRAPPTGWIKFYFVFNAEIDASICLICIRRIGFLFCVVIVFVTVDSDIVGTEFILAIVTQNNTP